jgi:pantoate kinase
VELNLPHKAPILFAKQILSKEQNTARVLVEFESAPSLAMLIEAAAQSASALGESNSKMGFLVSLKNIQLTQKIEQKELVIEVKNECDFGQMRSMAFEVFQNELRLASGSLVIKLEES